MNSDYSNNPPQYEERIDIKQGNYIVASGRDFEGMLEKKCLDLGDLNIKPGETTCLYGWFEKPVEFCGFLKNAAIFYLGAGDSDLFSDGGQYYDVTYIIETGRIFKSYKPGSGRDYFLRQKKGKYYWN